MKTKELPMSALSVIALSIGGLLTAASMMAWGADRLANAFRRAMLERTGILIVGFVAGVVAHELLHAVGWTLASGKGWQAVSFGFQVKTLSPYVHLEEPLPARAYRVGTLLPGAALGLLPWVVGMLTGDGLFTLFGILFTTMAGGDLTSIWLLRRAGPDQLVQDHPERMGVYLLMDDEG
jgi:hypothetical protein